MKTGTLTKNEDGTLTALLTDELGIVETLTATRSAAGYDVVVVVTHMPEDMWVIGDQEYFEMVKSK